jgi:outer membrane protein OmpA-like peptidoglycan-associated protein
MKYLLLLLLFPGLCEAQENLVANGGFGAINLCREYETQCGAKGWFPIPIGSFYLNKGKGYDPHYAELVAYDFRQPFERSFIETELLCPLVKDSTYIIELFVQGTCMDPGKLGVYMTSRDFLLEKKDYSSFRPTVQYTNPSQLSRSDRRGWYRLKLPFKATGIEKFMVIGNFSEEEDFSHCARKEERVIYAIDAVSLKPLYGGAVCDTLEQLRERLFARTERHSILRRNMRPPEEVVVKETISKKPRPVRIDTLIIPDVLFAVNDYSLNRQAQFEIRQFMGKLNAVTIDSVVVEGHTDSTGSVTSNELLSLNRARSVARYIADQVFPQPPVIAFRGWASTKPAATNRTVAGRQKNRRVEIYVYRKE